MIARLAVASPFPIALPEGATFKVYTYEDEGYQVSLFPPERSDVPANNVPDSLTMNDAPAFFATALRVDFQRPEFKRTQGGPYDPPDPVIRRALDSFLYRLRYVTRGAQVHLLTWPNVSWRLRYLNDDGSELVEDLALVRGRGVIGFRLSWVGLNPSVWEHIHELPVEFTPPVWDQLRLDAEAALPSVGTTVVLSATCLEVFIAQVLDGLAQKSPLPADLWHWLNDRDAWQKEPSTDEQFDVLLKLFTQHSLKEDEALWRVFKELRRARNSFVHEGVAEVGGKALDTDDAVRLLNGAGDIIAWVRQWLPEDLRWAEFRHDIKFNAQTTVFR